MEEMPQDSLTTENRAIVLDFVDIVPGQRAIRRALEKHVCEDHVQHSWRITNGRENTVIALEAMFAQTGM